MSKQKDSGVILTPKGEGNNDGDITISEEEMTSLGEFLSSVQQYILNHEARLEAIEELIHEGFHFASDGIEDDESADA